MELSTGIGAVSSEKDRVGGGIRELVIRINGCVDDLQGYVAAFA